jgi:hypothetical protein
MAQVTSSSGASQETTPPPPHRPRAGRRIAIGVAVLVLAAGAVAGIILHNQTTAPTSASNPIQTGCPSAAAPPSGAPAPNETITLVAANSVTQAHVGDIIAVLLPSSAEFYWTAQPAPATALQTLAPAGYYDPIQHACVWRFKATAAGQNTLTFTRQMRCTKGIICSPLILEVRFALAVH